MCFTLLVVAALVAGCGKSAPPARRGIVTLSPALTEVVFALGCGGDLVGVTTACDYPPEAKKLPKLTDRVVNFEAVLDAAPETVLADMTVNTPEEVARLRGLGLRVAEFRATSLAETAEMIRDIGYLLDAEDRARELAAKLETPPVERDPKPRVLFTLGTDGLWVAGQRTLAADCVRRGGGVNVTDDQGRYYSASKEALLVADPQVIFTVGPPEDFLNDPTWALCGAVRKRAVYQVDPSLFNRPTPRLAEGVAALTRLLDRDEWR